MKVLIHVALHIRRGGRTCTAIDAMVDIMLAVCALRLLLTALICAARVLPKVKICVSIWPTRSATLAGSSYGVGDAVGAAVGAVGAAVVVGTG